MGRGNSTCRHQRRWVGRAITAHPSDLRFARSLLSRGCRSKGLRGNGAPNGLQLLLPLLRLLRWLLLLLLLLLLLRLFSGGCWR